MVEESEVRIESGGPGSRRIEIVFPQTEQAHTAILIYQASEGDIRRVSAGNMINVLFSTGLLQVSLTAYQGRPEYTGLVNALALTEAKDGSYADHVRQRLPIIFREACKLFAEVVSIDACALADQIYRLGLQDGKTERSREFRRLLE